MTREQMIDVAVWKAVFERDNYTCVLCSARASKGHRVELQADHILPFASHPDVRFEIDNGRTLCAPCHRQTPTWGFTGKSAILESSGESFEAVTHARVA